MKKPWLWLCVVLAGTLSLQAQAPIDVTGTWQGTMQPQGAPREMRVLMKVSKDDGVLKVAAYLVDQAGNALNANSAAPVFDPPRPDLYTALQEQLGLKATASKAPAKVMVFEKVEKPSEN